MKPNKQAFREFLGRYLQVWRQTWAIRHSLDTPKKHKDELEFLPAHLELIETPISAAPKWTARLVMLFALIALLWALFGKMDIVAVASGKVTTSDRRKLIQPIETAMIHKIHVKDGQYVHAGDTLIELTAAGIDSDVSQGAHSLGTAQLTILRSEALLSALQHGTAPTMDTSALSQTGADQKSIYDAQALLRNQHDTWKIQDTQLSTAQATLQGQLDAIHHQLSLQQQSLNIEKKKAQDYQSLLSIEAISQHEYYNQQNKLIDLNQRITGLQGQKVQLNGQIQDIVKQRSLAKQHVQQAALDALNLANHELKNADNTLQKAQERQSMMTLKAPTDGNVQELSIHTEGGVVTPAQTLMVIAPTDDVMEVEAFILNKDIGFVHEAQTARIKVESFPYTRYGYLTGRIKSLSKEATQHEQLGLIYPAIIALDNDTLQVEGKRIQLTSGMNITAEIKTGKRRVIDYLLSPLQTKVDESLKER